MNKKRILFISSCNIIAGDLARLLKREGNEVKLFIDDKDRKLNFENMVGKTNDWKKELNWVGKEGLIVFDDVGYGKIQDKLRKDGYSVFGGSKLGEKLELEREYAQKIFREYNLQTLETIDFKNIDECVKFIKKSHKNWVLKQNNHKLNINCVSQLDDNLDIIDLLGFCKDKYKKKIKRITIQEKIEGVEIGIGRFFNGNDWIGPIEINFEHKHFLSGNIGPLTTEMGTLGWYESNEENILFKNTISKLKPFLKKAGFKGDFEINFIANKKGLFPLDVTSRLGSPMIYLQSDIHTSPWNEFMRAIADGKEFNLKWKKGYGLVVLIAVPPFPYISKSNRISLKGMNIYLNKLNEDEVKHVHFEGIAKEKSKKGERFFISDGEGYILYVTGIGKTVEEAMKKVYNIVRKIYIPKMLYRNDIGLNFLNHDRALLKKWGYL